MLLVYANPKNKLVSPGCWVSVAYRSTVCNPKSTYSCNIKKDPFRQQLHFCRAFAPQAGTTITPFTQQLRGVSQPDKKLRPPSHRRLLRSQRLATRSHKIDPFNPPNSTFYSTVKKLPPWCLGTTFSNDELAPPWNFFPSAIISSMNSTPSIHRGNAIQNEFLNKQFKEHWRKALQICRLSLFFGLFYCFNDFKSIL